MTGGRNNHKADESVDVDTPLVERARFPDLPLGDEELTFEAPWQARAFAVAVVLSDHYEGAYSWADFQERLVEEIQSDESERRDGDGCNTHVGAIESESRYYEQWLRALERVVLESGLIDAGEVSHRVAEFAAGDRDASEFVEGEHDHGEGTYDQSHDHGGGY